MKNMLGENDLEGYERPKSRVKPRHNPMDIGCEKLKPRSAGSRGRLRQRIANMGGATHSPACSIIDGLPLGVVEYTLLVCVKERAYRASRVNTGNGFGQQGSHTQYREIRQPLFRRDGYRIGGD